MAKLRDVTVSGGSLGFVRAGGRDLDLTRLGLDSPANPGESLRLYDDQGLELGLALADPENGLARLMVTPSDELGAIDGSLCGIRVERALAFRKALGLVELGATYRLLHGAGDGLPGFACDVLGRYAALWVYGEALVPLGRKLADAIRGFARLDGVVLKTRRRGAASQAHHEVIGSTPPDPTIGHEHGVPFELHLQGGTNTGLFTDMREQRRGLGRMVSGRRVLNLFSYTGALSVAAARAGAASVCSVDTSDGVQAWAQNNFRRSGLDPADKRWKFEVGDAVRFLDRAKRERERYDAILIDPPTFSTARGSAWQVERDYPELIGKAAEVLSDGGSLWLSANSHELKSLPALAQAGLAKVGRYATILEVSGLPPDYPTLAAQPKDRYLQIVWLRV